MFTPPKKALIKPEPDFNRLWLNLFSLARYADIYRGDPAEENEPSKAYDAIINYFASNPKLELLAFILQAEKAEVFERWENDPDLDTWLPSSWC